MRKRFAYFYKEDSLALEALLLMPGIDRFEVVNFEVSQVVIESVRNKMIDDFVELLPPNMNPARKQQSRAVALATLDIARSMSVERDLTEDPLVWWPSHPELSSLIPLAKMLLAIPASTADDEKTFSSAGITLSKLRKCLDVDNCPS